MPRFECSNYQDWRIRQEDFNAVGEFCSIFKDCRLELSFIAGSGTIVLDYEIGMAKKPVTFFGFTVDLDDGWIYLTKVGDIPSLKVGLISDLFRYFTGSVVSRDAALRAVEKFKLTGSLSKMFDTMDESIDGSMISASLHKVVRTSINIRTSKVEDFAKMYRKVGKAFRNAYQIFTNTDSVSNDVALQVQKDFVMVKDGGYRSSEWVPEEGTTEDSLYLASTPAYWRDKQLLNKGSSAKRSLLASNVLEVCDSMDGAEDVVLSTDVSKRLKNLGFDTLLTSRELASITSNSSYIETMKKQSSVDANTVDSDWGRIKIVGYAGNPMDTTAGVIRNSIKMLNKVIVKIKSIKEGK